MTDGVDLEAFAALGVKFDTLANEIRETNRHLDFQPISHRRSGSVFVPSPTATCGFDLGGPSSGRRWYVRRLVVGGVTWGTNVGSTTAEAYAVASGASVFQNVRDIQYLFDQAPSLPSVAFYTPRQVIVDYPEKLIVLIIAGTAGQQLVGHCQVDDFPLAAVQRDEYAL